MTVGLTTGNITATGVTSGQSATASGSATNATHTQDAGGFIPRHSGSSGYPAIY